MVLDRPIHSRPLPEIVAPRPAVVALEASKPDSAEAPRKRAKTGSDRSLVVVTFRAEDGALHRARFRGSNAEQMSRYQEAVARSLAGDDSVLPTSETFMINVPVGDQEESRTFTHAPFVTDTSAQRHRMLVDGDALRRFGESITIEPAEVRRAGHRSPPQ